jgi:hypothetical protein
MIKREATLPTQPDHFVKSIMAKFYGRGQFDQLVKPVGQFRLGHYMNVIGDTLIFDATGPGYREYDKVMQFKMIQVAEWQTKVIATCRELEDMPRYFITLWRDLLKEYGAKISAEDERAMRIADLFDKGKSDQDIGADPKVFLGQDRVKQIRLAMGLKYRERTKRLS